LSTLRDGIYGVIQPLKYNFSALTFLLVNQLVVVHIHSWAPKLVAFVMQHSGLDHYFMEAPVTFSVWCYVDFHSVTVLTCC